jgi:colicin import membrane protein
MDWLRDAATSHGLSNFWIGFNDKSSENKFEWFGNV